MARTRMVGKETPFTPCLEIEEGKLPHGNCPENVHVHIVESGVSDVDFIVFLLSSPVSAGS